MNKVFFTRTCTAAIQPTRKYLGDAAYDIYVLEDTVIPMDKVIIVPTGIKIALPEGYYAELHPRSSFVLRGGYMKIGILDEGYRGDIGAIVISLIKPIQVKRGDRIAQIIIKKREEVDFKEVYCLPKSDRGVKGFGSSGN